MVCTIFSVLHISFSFHFIFRIVSEKYRKIADSPYDLGLTWYGLHKEAGGKFKYTNGKLAVKYQFAKYEELEECVSVSFKKFKKV